ILLGTVLGGLLLHVRLSGVMLNFDLPYLHTPIDTAAEAAITVIVAVYAVAALVCAVGVAVARRLRARP
ncbi:MAG: hypothetical protein ACRDP3_23080, partial [Streptomyces sp.]|uniref:hypothetical protein n=1 Tax=Streptomyces sp. TaxID=1931 RepID=UPI003D6A0E74